MSFLMMSHQRAALIANRRFALSNMKWRVFILLFRARAFLAPFLPLTSHEVNDTTDNTHLEAKHRMHRESCSTGAHLTLRADSPCQAGSGHLCSRSRWWRRMWQTQRGRCGWSSCSCTCIQAHHNMLSSSLSAGDALGIQEELEEYMLPFYTLRQKKKWSKVTNIDVRMFVCAQQKEAELRLRGEYEPTTLVNGLTLAGVFQHHSLTVLTVRRFGHITARKIAHWSHKDIRVSKIYICESQYTQV